MSRYPNEHKALTRNRILESADRLMKSQGIPATSVDAVMRDAGMTVGGFYAHFPSKEALARESLLHGLEASVDRFLSALALVPDGAPFARALIGSYLAQADEPDLGHACPMTLLLADVARAGRAWQNGFAERTGALLERIAARFPDVPGMSRRQAALTVYTSCVGAVVIARALASPAARRRIVRTTEKMLWKSLDLGDPQNGSAIAYAL